MIKITTIDMKIKFDFEKYCNLILAVVPKIDLIGIEEIRFVKYFSHPKTDTSSLGCYLQSNHSGKAAIELNIKNIAKDQIPEFNFQFYPEIASMLLSHTIFHEIGHHVHTFKRHRIRKRNIEEFAEKYCEACYYKYLVVRRKKILLSYRFAEWDFINTDKEGRNIARQSRKQILDWLDKNKNGIPFPS